MDTDKMQEAYEAANAFRTDFDADFIDILQSSHEGVNVPPDEEYDHPLPEHQVKVVIDVVGGDHDSVEYASQYTYPVCNFGRDLGLYVFDHVVYLGDETRNARSPQKVWESDAVVMVRFGLQSDLE